MLAKAKPPLVETTMAARHKDLGVHESYMQGCQDTRDQKYEAQMLDPSCVVKYVAPRTSANPNALIFLLLQRLSYLSHWQNRQLAKLKK
jgi:hypothetical protein